jgi:hypothetical protein
VLWPQYDSRESDMCCCPAHAIPIASYAVSLFYVSHDLTNLLVRRILTPQDVAINNRCRSNGEKQSQRLRCLAPYPCNSPSLGKTSDTASQSSSLRRARHKISKPQSEISQRRPMQRYLLSRRQSSPAKAYAQEEKRKHHSVVQDIGNPVANESRDAKSFDLSG